MERLRSYTVRRGGTKRMLICLTDPAGSTIGLTPTVHLRLLPLNKDRLVGDEEEVASAFTTEAFAGGTIDGVAYGPGWYAKLSSAITADLLPNREYLATAQIVIDSSGEPYLSRSWKHPVIDTGKDPT